MNFYELLLAKQLAGGGGGSAVINPLSVSVNGTYSAPEGVDGYNPVEVAVPMPSGTYSIGANGDYDIASYASAHVSVPTGVFPTGTSNITSNGTYDVTNYATASVNVSGGGGDTKFKELVEKTLSTVEDSTIQYIGPYAFTSCTSLTTASFPNATDIGTFAFNKCSELVTISFPHVINIGGSAFSSCTSLTTVNFPSATNISSSAFNGCTSLTTASFPNATNIAAYAFNKCLNLLSLYLMGSIVPTLTNSSTCFNNTPIGGYTVSTGGVYGSIFVPSSLYNTYITAANWSYYSARFVSV